MHPTEPGWYFWRHKDWTLGKWTMCHVVLWPTGCLCGAPWQLHVDYDTLPNLGGEWGPRIPEPPEEAGDAH